MLKFYKYHGTGNDFIFLNDFTESVGDISKQIIKNLCDRRFGIGADGLMILKKHPEYDFEMDYYNADGSGATMCGNGGRCIVAFAKKLGIINETAKFLASDGLHEALIHQTGIIELKMNETEFAQRAGEDFTCYTGSPHYIKFIDEIETIDVYKEGKNVRYSEQYRTQGINVNFVELINPTTLKIRTYERGVENETYACGTGSVASVLTHAQINHVDSAQYTVLVKGGKLNVRFEKKDDQFVNVWLIGPAAFVFEGKVNPDVLGIM